MPKRESLTVGERVRVWFTAGPGEKCTIKKVLSPVCLELLDHEGKHAYIHPRQCVRLKPRPPKEAQKPIVRWYSDGKNGYGEHITKVPQSSPSYVRLVECPEGSRVLSREELEIAWNSVFSPNEGATDKLAKALGFEVSP
jgi:hypothetical protein